jgi:hypothetical protein
VETGDREGHVSGTTDLNFLGLRSIAPYPAGPPCEVGDHWCIDVRGYALCRANGDVLVALNEKRFLEERA